MATTAPPTTLPPTTLAPTSLAPTTAAPTSLAPTSLAPTTSAPTTVPPTFLTTAVPTTSPPTTFPPTTPPPLDIYCGPIDITVTVRSYFSYFPSEVPDSALDTFFSAGPIEIEINLAGSHLHLWANAAPGILITVTIEGEIVIGAVLGGDSIDIEVTLHTYGFVTEANKSNWVKWSKIGYLDFTLDESNLAGERPVDWPGWVYGIRKLSDTIIVYGQNGISVMKPYTVHYGMTTIYRQGIKGKGAVTGDDTVHFFIDTEGKMFKLDPALTKLDYSEYLSLMTDPVMSYDPRNRLVYICDGTYGYIYGVDSGSFGEGPINVTGMGVKDGDIYVASPAAIVTPNFEICTDTFDFGTRKMKTIDHIEVGSDLINNLYTTVEYRKSYKEFFTRIDWHLVNPDGMSYPKCYGVEFRFRVKSMIYDYFEIDYIRIAGQIHGFSYLDVESVRLGSE